MVPSKSNPNILRRSLQFLLSFVLCPHPFDLPCIVLIQFRKSKNQIHEPDSTNNPNAEESFFHSLLSQDDDSYCPIDHSSHGIDNQLVDLESFNHDESLEKKYFYLLVSIHLNDCPGFIDESLFSPEDLDLHNF